MGIKIADSPEWLQNRLRIIGLKPINNVVDITNFVMHEMGNPLHAFDLEKVNGKIIVRTAEEGELLTTLDEVERKLDSNDLVICNANEPMCLAGVFARVQLCACRRRAERLGRAGSCRYARLTRASDRLG